MGIFSWPIRGAIHNNQGPTGWNGSSNFKLYPHGFNPSNILLPLFMCLRHLSKPQLRIPDKKRHEKPISIHFTRLPRNSTSTPGDSSSSRNHTYTPHRMAENCLGLESWAWIPNSFSFETEALTKALQVSLSEDSSGSSPPPPLHLLPRPDPFPQGSGSETPRRTRNPAGLQTGRISKRKSRASRGATTTFITADPANFRAMVQQVTGARFGPDDGPVFKPEPVRAGLDRVGFGSSGSQLCCLPTLDTSSAFLMDRVGVVGQDGSSGPMGGFEFEPVLSFPTLDSWAAM